MSKTIKRKSKPAEDIITDDVANGGSTSGGGRTKAGVIYILPLVRSTRFGRFLEKINILKTKKVKVIVNYTKKTVEIY